jgi:selenocysteine lyase/cysteine desulfurase
MMRSTLPTSHGFVPLKLDGKKKIFSPLPSSTSTNEFVSQFEYTGTIDNAPPLCIPAALKFRDEICGGEENIRAYRYELAEKGEQKIAEILGTKALEVPKASRVSFANVWLPLEAMAPHESPSDGFILTEDIPAVTDFLTGKMIEEYNCYVAISFYKGAWIVRFSSDIYLDMDDFIYGAEALKILCKRVKNLEYKV